MLLKNLVAILIIGLVFLGASASVSAQTTSGEETVVVGKIEKIDPQAKTITVRSHNDVVHAFAWTGKTVAHGIKEAALWTGHEAHVGANVAVHSVKVAGVDTFKALEWFGKGTPKVVEATVRYIGKDGKKIGLTVAGAAEEVFDVSEHALVVSGKAVGHGAKIAAKDTAKGAVATVHIVEYEGKKFIHFIEHKPKS